MDCQKTLQRAKAILTMNDSAQSILSARAALGEGPTWDAGSQVLYWVNILAGELHSFSPSTRQDRVVTFDQYLGFVVLRSRGGVVLGLQNGVAAYDFETAGLTWISRPETDKPENRFNDGKCAPDGRLFAGTMAIDEHPDAGTLYRIDCDLQTTPVARPVTISNGLAWSPDQKTMYYIDTPTRAVVAYDYAPETGEMSRPRIAVSVPASEGWPDGMTIDAEGMLWVAMWNGAKVVRYHPGQGKKIGELTLPALNVTSCAFGGPALDRLYITSARKGMQPEQFEQYPCSGDLFEAGVGVSGLPAVKFQG